MESAIQTVAAPNFQGSNSAVTVWTGRILSTLVALFLVFDGLMKVIKEPHVIAASAELGYSAHAIVGIGATLLACTLLYTIPRTRVLGALLLTAYLGGAVDANVRAGHPFLESVFPIIFGALTWSGLFLRDPQLLEMISLRKRS
jgi:sorbitol-specific phosphotransferase system component IIC